MIYRIYFRSDDFIDVEGDAHSLLPPTVIYSPSGSVAATTQEFFQITKAGAIVAFFPKDTYAGVTIRPADQAAA